SAEPGARLDRTGDRGRWMPGGEVEFLGRTDFQVKVRGFRIEPGEVEAALCGHPGVREAVVAVREDMPGEKQLVAYVVPVDGGGVGSAELREALGARLPEYMVPSAFVVLEQLPLTSNGKVDRRALPAPQPGVETAYVAPRTEIEELLCGIWLEVLSEGGAARLDRVGIHDNFFELGGHSLLATQVVARIREVFGIEVLLQALFGSPTVARFGEVVEQQLILGADAAELAEELSRLEPVSGTDAVP
ncbi:MAG TPA: phosphopantetheine-binding protein, partial [Longimicrobiaceae bacterium]|nr:phosphopantetheine-binding protein [Longimicrobiaceae bacterium]